MPSKIFYTAATALAVSVGVGATDQLPDPKAPKVTDLTYGPDVVPTGSAFTVSLTASDPVGVDRVSFSAYPNQGWWYPCQDVKEFKLVNGTALEGTWQAECPIAAGTPNQIYAFNYNVVATDGKNTYMTFKDGFGVSGGPEAEYEAPEILKVSNDQTVNAGTMLDIYLTVSDVSGVDTSMSYVNLHEAVGNYLPCSAVDFLLDSGTATDGVFKASCSIPADTPNGDYWFEVHVYDTQKNPAELRVDNAVEVVNGAAPDHTPPKISDMTYTNDKVERGQVLSVTSTVSDEGNNQSGIDYVKFQARESYTQALLCEGDMTLQTGDMNRGQWTFSCEVPSDSMISYYTGAVYAFDNQNNEGMMSRGFSVVMPTAL